jgi:hypothetical protein
MLKSPLPTTRVVFPNKKLKGSLRMLKNTKMLMKKSERELKPRTPWKAMSSVLNTLSTIKNSRISSMLPRKTPS